MSSVITVKDRFPWRKDQIRDLLIFSSLAVIGAVGLGLGLVTNNAVFPAPIGGALLAIAMLIVIVSVIGNTMAKRNSTMLADMDASTWRANFWMHKPTRAIWGDKLTRSRNQGDLDTTQQISAAKVGKNKVIVFALADDTKLYLPERLYKLPAVSKFLLQWVQHNNGKVNTDSKASMEEFAAVLKSAPKA